MCIGTIVRHALLYHDETTNFHDLFLGSKNRIEPLEIGPTQKCAQTFSDRRFLPQMLYVAGLLIGGWARLLAEPIDIE
jgi:hypothetical protein